MKRFTIDKGLDERGGLEDEDLLKGTMRMNVSDECGKLNLNYVSEDTLRDLLIVTGVAEEEAIQLAAAIVDWRDEDNEPIEVDEGDHGDVYTEDSYYNPDQRRREIEAMGPEYVNKNAPFDDVDELLLVRGMTRFILYGEDLNGNGKLDDNEDDGAASPPDDNEDGKLQLGLAPYVTVYSEGKVNINTAPRVVWEAILRSFDEGDAENLAEDIVEYRLGSDDEPGTRDDRPFRTLDDSDGDDFDLTRVPGWDDEISRIVQMGVSSDVFTIESIGEIGGVERRIRAVVKRDFVEPETLKGKATETRKNEEEIDERQPVEFFVLRYFEEGL
jgi:hypothetical protein